MAVIPLPKLKYTSSEMEKIDRLGWVAGLAFVSHGARLGIRVNHPSVLDQLTEYLPPGWNPLSSPLVDHLYSVQVGRSDPVGRVRRYHLLYRGSVPLVQSMELEEVFQALESDLHFRVALAARRCLFVHAGVVAWRGRAVVIAGRSMSGKTTLVEALVRAGATYYSDEYAVFDARGRVHPYPKPLNLRQANGAPPKQCSVEELGGVAGSGPLPVGLIVIAKYEAGARWRPQVLSPGDALLALLDNTVLARIRPRLALTTLRNVALGAIGLKSKRGEAQEVAKALLRRLEAESPPPAGPDNGALRRNRSGDSARTRRQKVRLRTERK